jgi:WD40 repeat protein
MRLLGVIVCTILVTMLLSGCGGRNGNQRFAPLSTPESSAVPSQPVNSLVAETAEADILKQNFDDVVKPVSGWQKSLFKVISDTQTIYSEDKMDGTASRLASYNWDTKQSAVIWEGQDKIILIELVPDQENVQELHFETSGGDTIRWFKFTEGKVQELTDEQTTNRYNRKLWFPDGERYLYLHDTGKSLGDGAGPEKVPAIYDVKQKKETILPFEKGFYGSLQWMKPGETVLASTGYDDIVQVKILNLKEMSELMILNTDKIGDTHIANNPSRHQVLIAAERKVRLYTDHAEQIDVRHQLDYSQEKFTTAFYSFSPDGNKLVYTLGSSSGSKVLIADGDATNLKTLTNDDLGILHLEWTPTSSHLIAAFQIPNTAEVYMGRIVIAKANT